jgi:hypothetical protein
MEEHPSFLFIHVIATYDAFPPILNDEQELQRTNNFVKAMDIHLECQTFWLECYICMASQFGGAISISMFQHTVVQ